MGKLGKGRLIIALILLMLLLTACRREEIPPMAVINGDSETAIGTEVTFDGSHSVGAQVYRWMILARPVYSEATLSRRSGSTVSLTPDMAGEYLIGLVVNNGQIDSPLATQKVHVTGGGNQKTPVVDTKVVVAQGLTTEVVLSASSIYPVEGELEYLWSLIAKPRGSQAEIINKAAASTTFVADYCGNYLVKLTVKDKSQHSRDYTMLATVVDPVKDLKAEILGTRVRITWKTSIPSTSAIEYEDYHGSLKRVENPERVTEHSIIVSGLEPFYCYKYHVFSVDENGYERVADGLFKTSRDGIAMKNRIEQVIYDVETDRAYLLDQVDRKILIFNPNTQTFEEEIQLQTIPVNLCIAHDRQSIYVVNSGTSFITELDLNTHQRKREIYWRPFGTSGNIHMYYREPNMLYMYEDNWMTNNLIALNLDTLTFKEYGGSFSEIMALTFSSDHKVAYLLRKEAPFWDCWLEKYDTTSAEIADWKRVQRLNMNNAMLTSDIPIILLEKWNMVIVRNLVFNASNFQKLRELQLVELWCANPSETLVVGHRMYRLPDFELLDFHNPNIFGWSDSHPNFLSKNNVLFINSYWEPYMINCVDCNSLVN